MIGKENQQKLHEAEQQRDSAGKSGIVSKIIKASIVGGIVYYATTTSWFGSEDTTDVSLSSDEDDGNKTEE